VEGEYVRVQGARARYGEGAIDLDGWLSWSADAPAAKFQLRGQDVALDEELVAALPEMLAGVLRPLTPRGRMRFTLSPVMRGAGTEREWRVTGELSLSAATLDVGLKLTELEATLDGAASVLAGGRAVMDAAFVIDSARLAGRPLRDVAGRLLSDPANPWLRLNDLHGQLCGGDFLGFVRIDPRTQDYELSLTLRGVEFGQLMPPKDETAPPRSGLVEGRVYLRGTAGAPESRQGGGRLRLSGASLLQTPVVADVARERQQQTDELRDLLNVADVEFIWIGDMLTFERVTIDSPDLRLVGTGAWNMATNALRLTLVGSHPRDWPRIPLLTALAETAGQELIQYQVRGTTAAPRVSAEPLYKLNAALRALLLGEAE
jgi:hypothetical protein